MACQVECTARGRRRLPQRHCASTWPFSLHRANQTSKAAWRESGDDVAVVTRALVSRWPSSHVPLWRAGLAITVVGWLLAGGQEVGTPGGHAFVELAVERVDVEIFRALSSADGW